MERKISFKNLYLVGVISLGLIGLGIGSTFAMFTASAEINDSISMTSGLEYTDDVVDLVDMSISSNEVETATLNITNNTDKTLNYTSWYKTNDSNLQIGTVVSNDYSVTGTIEPNQSAQIIVSIRNRGTGVAKVTVGISASDGDIVVSDGITTLPSNPLPPYLNDYITSLYTSNKDDGTVTNNSIEYKYASSVNLMNDRLGGTTEDLDGGNIRYYGASPNNYIDIGDRDSNDIAVLYRIVGVFDNKVKVVRNESIGNYSWDTSSSDVNEGKGINEWSQADLMKHLNPGYNNNKDKDNEGNTITVNNSLWWNGGNGICYNASNNASTTCDSTNIGLSNNAKAIISSTKWYIDGWTTTNVYPNQAYIAEKSNNVIENPVDNIARTTVWFGKIGLISGSDYGYSTDLALCSELIRNYNNSNCLSNSWLSNNSEYIWTITSKYNADSERLVYYIKSDGSYGAAAAADNYSIKPTFYLIENTVLESGTGTSNDPFVVD